MKNNIITNKPKENSDAPSPLELAQTAIALCQLRKKDPEVFPPSRYFTEALELLAEARSHLKENWEANLANFKIDAGLEFPEVYRAAGKPIPFRVLLQERDELHDGKKPATLISPITTQNGLEKAVRRYFPDQKAKRIIKIKAITCDEFDQLRKAQKEAIRKRSAKRVKRRSD